MAQQLICSSCGQVGSSKNAIKGNGLIEIILWLCFLIPGLIYSIWRSSSRHKACAVCGSTSLVPIDTPIGKKMLADQGKTIDEVLSEIKNRKMPLGRKIWIGVIVLFAFFALIGMINAFSS